ncbi:translation initiation factor IF-2-like [Zalophus californianus]|uniref:Translation initiation factor IF-2-like n=1 Tax=Zalophus californianus TaxID=9704 RepID=A0A6J2F7M8_ZALCA|nr:translation initiation factor IF-2-like [Zalophus californianus]
MNQERGRHQNYTMLPQHSISKSGCRFQNTGPQSSRLPAVVPAPNVRPDFGDGRHPELPSSASSADPTQPGTNSRRRLLTAVCSDRQKQAHFPITRGADVGPHAWGPSAQGPSERHGVRRHHDPRNAWRRVRDGAPSCACTAASEATTRGKASLGGMSPRRGSTDSGRPVPLPGPDTEAGAGCSASAPPPPPPTAPGPRPPPPRRPTPGPGPQGREPLGPPGSGGGTAGRARGTSASLRRAPGRGRRRRTPGGADTRAGGQGPGPASQGPNLCGGDSVSPRALSVPSPRRPPGAPNPRAD